MCKYGSDMNETELGETRQRSQALEPREHFRSRHSPFSPILTIPTIQ